MDAFTPISSSLAMPLLVAHTLAYKVYMTAVYRLKTTDDVKQTPNAQVQKILASQVRSIGCGVC